MIKNIIKRFFFALSLAFGVSFLLSLIFDSGAFGDPALIQAGHHADAAEIGHLRQQQGRFTQFKPQVVQLRLNGPLRRLIIDSDGDNLLLKNHLGKVLRNFSTKERTIDTVFLEWTLEEKGLLETNILGDPELGKLPASGLAAALSGTTPYLDAGSSLTLAWAQPAPFYKRIVIPCLNLLCFNFGENLKRRPLSEELIKRAPRSAAIAVPAFILTLWISISLALWCLRRKGLIDKSFQLLSALGMSLSAVVWVMLFQQYFAAELKLFPVYGWQSPFVSFAALPIITWVAVGIWPQWRFWRELASEYAQQDFMRAAHARGLNAKRSTNRHLLAMLAPQIAVQALGAIPFLVLGSLLVERFFGIPGLGSLTADAVRDGDINTLRASTFCLALIFLFSQLLCDWAVHKLDPRVNHGAQA